MRRKNEEEQAAARRAALAPPTYLAIDVPKDLGMDCGTYRWRQNQSHVEIFIPLPENLSTSKISVVLRTSHIKVELDERTVLKGDLRREIKAEESTWYVQDRVLEIILLKRNRKGNYENGKTNADTFWRAVLRSAPEGEMLKLEHPPTAYYWAPCDDEEQKKKEKELAAGQRRRLPPPSAAPPSATSVLLPAISE